MKLSANTDLVSYTPNLKIRCSCALYADMEAAERAISKFEGIATEGELDNLDKFWAKGAQK